MFWSRMTWARVFAALTLVIAAFAVAPVADAMTCAPEAAPSHQAIDHPPEAGDHGGAGGEHGLCAHGHCHHTFSQPHPASGLSLADQAASTRYGPPGGEGAVGAADDGIARPPRG